MRVCLVYDCLYPYTVGGAERWYRNLAERLARAGHEVTYLTLRQWESGEPTPEIAGVHVITVGPRMPLYRAGRRAIWPPLRFGWGVLVHLARRGRDYDVVHTASFPYFSLLGAALARRHGRYAIVVDWHEVWSASYWREYLGAAGWIGRAVQRACVHVHQRAFCFSDLYAERLREEGLRGEVTVLHGEYAGPLEPQEPREPELRVVFAGRMIPEKRAPLVVDAAALAAERIPGLQATLFGDGPDLGEVRARIDALEPPRAPPISAPGFVDGATVHEAMRSALCLLLPSSREGYGLVIVEAARCGTPSIVVEGPDNAAVELIEDGVNGVIAASAAPQALADAIVAVHRAGEQMRASTRDWFAANARRLSLEHSLDTVLAAYAP